MERASSGVLDSLLTPAKHHEAIQENTRHLWEGSGSGWAGLRVLASASQDTGTPLPISALPGPESVELSRAESCGGGRFDRSLTRSDRR